MLLVEFYLSGGKLASLASASLNATPLWAVSIFQKHLLYRLLFCFWLSSVVTGNPDTWFKTSVESWRTGQDKHQQYWHFAFEKRIFCLDLWPQWYKHLKDQMTCQGHFMLTLNTFHTFCSFIVHWPGIWGDRITSPQFKQIQLSLIKVNCNEIWMYWNILRYAHSCALYEPYLCLFSLYA